MIFPIVWFSESFQLFDEQLSNEPAFEQISKISERWSWKFENIPETYFNRSRVFRCFTGSQNVQTMMFQFIPRLTYIRVTSCVISLPNGPIWFRDVLLKRAHGVIWTFRKGFWKKNSKGFKFILIKCPHSKWRYFFSGKYFEGFIGSMKVSQPSLDPYILVILSMKTPKSLFSRDLCKKKPKLNISTPLSGTNQKKAEFTFEDLFHPFASIFLRIISYKRLRRISLDFGNRSRTLRWENYQPRPLKPQKLRSAN